ncbi:MAG: OadG family protein [Leptospirales bacterium]
MVISGLKLMAMGMGVVFVYLVVMIVLIQFIATLLRTAALSEENEQKTNGAGSRKPAVDKQDKSKLVAVISAAVETHRSKS